MTSVPYSPKTLNLNFYLKVIIMYEPINSFWQPIIWLITINSISLLDFFLFSVNDGSFHLVHNTRALYRLTSFYWVCTFMRRHIYSWHRKIAFDIEIGWDATSLGDDECQVVTNDTGIVAHYYYLKWELSHLFLLDEYSLILLSFPRSKLKFGM